MRRKKRRSGFLKGLLVVLIASGATIAAIHASDTIRIPGVALLAGVGGIGSQEKARCPSDMVYVSDGGGGFCIDRYENSTGPLCGKEEPANQFETSANMAQSACTTESKKDKKPWVNVDLHQAMTLCARVGKHLANPHEWYRAALGTPDEVSKSSRACALGHIGQERADKTGMHDDCVSSYGAYDMVGNVWEWVDANIADGTYAGRTLPEEGFVAEADVDGIASKTGPEPIAPFGGDQWFVNKSELRGMFRGGFWSMEEKAGIYAVNATIPPSFVGNAVGFRCAQ